MERSLGEMLEARGVDLKENERKGSGTVKRVFFQDIYCKERRYK